MARSQVACTRWGHALKSYALPFARKKEGVRDSAALRGSASCTHMQLQSKLVSSHLQRRDMLSGSQCSRVGRTLQFQEMCAVRLEAIAAGYGQSTCQLVRKLAICKCYTPAQLSADAGLHAFMAASSCLSTASTSVLQHVQLCHDRCASEHGSITPACGEPCDLLVRVGVEAICKLQTSKVLLHLWKHGCNSCKCCVNVKPAHSISRSYIYNGEVLRILCQGNRGCKHGQ